MRSAWLMVDRRCAITMRVAERLSMPFITRVWVVGVQPAGGFVEAHDPRVAHEGCGYPDALHLTAGERGCAVAGGGEHLHRHGFDVVGYVG